MLRLLFRMISSYRPLLSGILIALSKFIPGSPEMASTPPPTASSTTREDAREVAQDVFQLRLGKSDPVRNEEGQGDHWVYAMTRNRAIDRLRSNRAALPVAG